MQAELTHRRFVAFSVSFRLFLSLFRDASTLLERVGSEVSSVLVVL